MKTIKLTIASLMMLVSMVGMASNDVTLKKKDPKSGSKAKEPYVKVDNGRVTVSILNREFARYNVSVYNDQGILVYNTSLGKSISLGKMFDFSNGEGTYTLKISNNKGSKYSFQVETEN